MSKFKNVIFLILLFVLVGAMWSVMNMTAEVDKYGYSDLVKDINADIKAVENGEKGKIESRRTAQKRLFSGAHRPKV